MIDDITNKALAELADAGRARRASAIKAAASVTDAADRLALYLELMRDAGRFNAATLAEDTSTPPPVVADYLIDAHRRRLLVSLGDGWYCVKPDAPALSVTADDTATLQHATLQGDQPPDENLCGLCGEGRIERSETGYNVCDYCGHNWQDNRLTD